MDERAIAELVQRLEVRDLRTRGVLLVDDELCNVKVLASFLEDRYVVHEASCGAQALEIARTTELDVVVTDQRMQGMTGVELLEQLRVLKPDVAGIVLTGYADTSTLVSAINRAAVFRFLKKPWEPAEVLAAVEEASRQVAQQRTIQQLLGLLARRTDELGRSLDEQRASQQRMLHLERLGTMGQLAAGITHDIRNVMVSLRAVEWELAQAENSPPDLVETVQVGMGGLDNLVRTLDALHSFARGGESPLNLRQVSPASIIQDAIAITRMDKNYRSRTVDVSIAPLLPVLRADAQKLTQVVVNLLRNALHATREKDHIRVGASVIHDDVVLSVEDDGPGVAVDQRERIFEPFISSKGDGGLGMGLYMARLIVNAHQGRISVTDGAQGGARFQVALPV